MQLPIQPVSLSVEQIQDLNRKLCTVRHDINNHLSLILAATELIRHKPQMIERMLGTLTEQPAKITDAIAQFTRDFENTFGINRS